MVHIRERGRFQVSLVRYIPLVAFTLLFAGSLLILTEVRRPYWTEPDPDYQYLLSAMNMARLQRAGYNHHPGITVKLIGVIPLRAVHLISGRADLGTDVLLRPELYLYAVNVTTIVLTAVALFWLGAIVLRTTGELLLAIVAQAASLVVAGQLVYHQLKYDAEPTLYVHSLCLGIACVTMLQEGTARQWFWRAVMCGIIVAGGTAAKLNFAPLAVVPLIALPRWRWRLAYAAAGMVAAGLIVAGVWREAHELKSVVVRSLGSGAHGGGPTRIPFAMFTQYLLQFLRYERPFFVAIGTSALLLVVGIAMRTVRTSLAHPAAQRIAFALLLGMVTQVLAVAKNKLTYYMMPAMGLAGPLLALAMAGVRPLGCGARVWMWRVLMVGVSIALLGHAVAVEQRSVRNWIRSMTERRNGTWAFFARLAPYAQGCAIVHDAMVMSQAAALSFGNAGYNQDELRRLYPNDYVYAGYLSRPDPFYHWSKPILAEDIIVRHTNVLLLFRCPLDYVKHNLPSVPIELVASGTYHLAYAFPTAFVQRVIAERRDALTVPNEISVRYVERTNLSYLEASHGTPRKPVLTWGPPNELKYAEFAVTAPTGGVYNLSVVYASGGYHPLDVYVNGVLVFQQVCGERTGGYNIEPHGTNMPLGRVVLRNGVNRIRLEARAMPCVAAIRFE